MIALPDVNVLVALAWPNHVHHEQARGWFEESLPRGVSAAEALVRLSV